MSYSSGKSGDLRIETLRGIAIIAVVSFHASMWLDAALAQLDREFSITSRIFQFYSEFFSPIRMPLFTVLSGWVYALRPFSLSTSAPFIQGKFRRIVLPLFFVSTFIYFLIYFFTPDTPAILGVRAPRVVQPEEFWVMWFYHFGHLWFLQVLIVLFAMIAIIDALKLMNTVKQWIFWLIISAIMYYYVPQHLDFWSLKKVAHIQVFFFFGIGLYRFREQIFSSAFVKYSSYFFVAALVIHYLLMTQQIGSHKIYWPFVVLAGIAGPIFLLSLNFTWKPFIWVGKYSYSIYLYHAVPGIVLTPFLVGLLESSYTHWIWFSVMLIAGFLIPILIETIGKKVPYLRTPLLGRKP